MRAQSRKRWGANAVSSLVEADKNGCLGDVGEVPHYLGIGKRGVGVQSTKE